MDIVKIENSFHLYSISCALAYYIFLVILTDNVFEIGQSKIILDKYTDESC